VIQSSNAYRLGTESRPPRLLFVQSDPQHVLMVESWFQNVRFIHSATAHDAGNVLRDARFIDSALDGLIVDVKLPDATGYRVVQDFRSEFRGVPIAMLGEIDDLCLSIWARARGIQVLRKPLQQPDLERWICGVGTGFKPPLPAVLETDC
jgi:DNA-binding response OmpR family regulator